MGTVLNVAFCRTTTRPGGASITDMNTHRIRGLCELNGEWSPLVCWFCRHPVPLESAKTDDRGQGIHEECYFQLVRQPRKIPPKSETLH
jgi:hypothetical protein